MGGGPDGAAAAVLVIEATDRALKQGQAPLALSRAVRERVKEDTGIELAAVLVVREHPTDIRHNSKIDRTALSTWAQKVLAGA